MCGCLSHAPTGDLTCDSGMCPEWDSNQWPFGSKPVLSALRPHQPGRDFFLFCNTSLLMRRRLIFMGEHFAAPGSKCSLSSKQVTNVQLLLLIEDVILPTSPLKMCFPTKYYLFNFSTTRHVQMILPSQAREAAVAGLGCTLPNLPLSPQGALRLPLRAALRQGGRLQGPGQKVRIWLCLS